MADPVAEFLEREKEQLGDLDDFKFEEEANNTTFNDEILNENDLNDAYPVAENDKDDDFMTMQNDSIAFEDNNVSTKTDSPAFGDSYKVPRIEPEKIRKWREDFEERIVKKDEAEKAKKVEMEKEAKRELEEWNKHYSEQLGNKQRLNRETEDAYETERTDTTVGDWQRVFRLCDFNANKTVAPQVGGPVISAVANTKDTSRMKGILMNIRTQPPTRA